MIILKLKKTDSSKGIWLGNAARRNSELSTRRYLVLKEPVNVLELPQFREDAVNKVTTLKTEELGADVYYFKPGQVLDFHRHMSDQIFLVLSGRGKFYLQNGHTQEFDVREGSNILAPKGVWHKLVNTGQEDLVAVQVTKLPTDLEQKH